MRAAPIPLNESARLAALAEYDILDTPPEAEFDDFTQLASYLCDTPISYISLVDETRQWFKSRVGSTDTETPRAQAFCAHTFETSAMLEVSDALDDERFFDNPSVTGNPNIRFYAGAPLLTPDGLALGTLCVIDRVPRTLTAAQRNALEALSRQVMRQLELRRVRRVVEHQRREQELIVASVADGLYGIGVDGSINMQNPASARMLGYATEALLGQDAHACLHRHRPDGSEYPLDACPIHATLEDGVTRVVYDDVFWRLDGTSLPVEYAVSARTNDQGLRNGAIVAFRDVTERRAVERLKSEFVSTVSHELRTPLTAIRAALGLALGGAVGELPAKVREVLDVASRNSERLTALINDLLDLEKIEAGRASFHDEYLELTEVVRRAVEMNQPYADRFDVHFRVAADSEPLPVLADEGRLMQVLTNLLSNAAKYSPRGGTVTISVERTGTDATVAVRDHGPGVPEHFRARLFSRFAQADSADARAKGGTGLGLSIAQAIVDRMHGVVDFENHPEGGAVFRVRLPIAPGMLAAAKDGQ